MRATKYKIFVFILIIVITLAVALTACTGSQTNILNIDTDIKYQTLEGFGASSCWWSQTVPIGSKAQAELARSLYSDSGIGLSVYRYNIGGGSADLELYGKDGGTQEQSGQPERNTYSFFDASKYDKSKSAKENFGDRSKYDTTKDSQAVSFMELCVSQQGSTVEEIILFSNSPHYLLTQSGKTHGDYEYQNNLPAENYEAYCEYLMQYLFEMAIVRKLPVSAVSPINEPQHRWGGSNQSQEGCHYHPQNLAAFYDVFYRYMDEFNARYGTNIQVSLFESGNYDTYKQAAILEYVYEMSKYEYFDRIDKISVHSYGEPLSDNARNSFMYKLNALWENKFSIEMSEICDMSAGVDKSMDGGIFLAKVIDKDIRLLSTVSWSWWIGASWYDYNDGLVGWQYYNGNCPVDLSIKRYSVMGQYSKFLQRGDTRVDVSWIKASNSAKSGISASAYVRDDGTVIAVIVNEGGARSLSLNGSYSTMQVVVTDGDNDMTTTYKGAFRSDLNLTAKSVTTVVLK